jgi:hypothetical protein
MTTILSLLLLLLLLLLLYWLSKIRQSLLYKLTFPSIDINVKHNLSYLFMIQSS